MPAYYNEFDAKKAAWLRELISQGLIAPGDVDERSIADVRPDELRRYAQCHFFAGIGIWSYALRLAGWPDDREVWTGSCPCQPFSAAGKGEAFDDERHLWPEFFRLIEARRPVVCFGEQVASIDGLAWLDLVQSDLDRADYTCGAVDLCAAGFGAPHRRQRLYWVAHAAIVGHDGRRSSEESGRPGESERLRDAGRLEDAVRPERRPDQCEPGGHRQEARRDEESNRPGERSKTEWLDDPAGARYDGAFVGSEGDSRDEAWMRGSSDGSAAGRVADTDGSDARTEREQRSRQLGQQPQDGRDVPVACGPVNGFWRDADWVLTRPQRVGDRPGLRPVERGAFPLAHGAPERVGRLRGYGDGIVAQVAQAFIEAYMLIPQTKTEVPPDPPEAT